MNQRKEPIYLKDSVSGLKKYITESTLVENNKSEKLMLLLNQLWLSERFAAFSTGSHIRLK